jgi:hypothetical protein
LVHAASEGPGIGHDVVSKPEPLLAGHA